MNKIDYKKLPASIRGITAFAEYKEISNKLENMIKTKSTWTLKNYDAFYDILFTYYDKYYEYCIYTFTVDWSVMDSKTVRRSVDVYERYKYLQFHQLTYESEYNQKTNQKMNINSDIRYKKFTDIIKKYKILLTRIFKKFKYDNVDLFIAKCEMYLLKGHLNK